MFRRTCGIFAYMLFFLCTFPVISDSGFTSQTVELTSTQKKVDVPSENSNVLSSDKDNEKWRAVVGKQDIYFNYIKIIASTFFVVLLILVIYFFLGKKNVIQNSSHIEIIETVSIDNSNKLIAAFFCNKIVLIGANSHGMNTLLEIDDTEIIEKIKFENKEKSSFDGMSFSEKLSSMGVKSTFPIKNKKYIDKTLDKINKIGV